MPNREVRVVVAGGREVVRRGIAQLLTEIAGVGVTGEATTAIGMLECAVDLDPDVVIVDLAKPRSEVLDAMRHVREARPRAEIVAMVPAGDDSVVRQAFGAGARGVVFDDAGSCELIDAIRRAAIGEYTAPEPPGGGSPDDYLRPVAGDDRPGGLVTPRERQIACLLADGYSTKEVASILGISVRTAETHRASILKKLGARNVADVVRYCIRSGLIDV